MSALHKSLYLYLLFPSLFFLCLWAGPLMAKEVIPIGVVLDLNSSIGRMATSCIRMAHQDFYKHYPHYQTRLDLRTRDSENDIVRAASAAFELIKNEKVHAIIGPQRSDQARFVIELGRKAHVPIISFSATSPSISPIRSQFFFIRTAQNDWSQVKAIATIVEAYGWREIIPIYEDTEYGNGLIPYLIDELEKVNTRVPYRSVIDPNSQKYEIVKELRKLKSKLSRIFLVHMTAEHGSKFFEAAKHSGMMKEGFAWIITQGLSAELDPMGPEAMDSMQGVLGIRPMMRNTKRLEDFKNRWKTLSVQTSSEPPLTFFGYWAYDTVWALATAVEVKLANSTLGKENVTLLDTILATKFSGLSGYFNLIEGQLEPSELEIFNLVGHKERNIGYWSPKRGLFHDGKSTGQVKLKQPIWPGDTTDQPTKLRIGVPVRKFYTEFVKVERKSPNSTPEISGLAIDVFLEVIKVLPFPLSYEFIPFEKKNGESAGSYDDLTLQIEKKVYDAVVGDITIVANRANNVDFTLPYLESEVKMVVSMKHDERRNMWIFLKPLSLGLWLSTGAAFVLTGFIIWLLEQRTNTEFQGSPQQQVSMMFWFSFSTLVFAHKERLESHWSRFVLIIWIFVVLILTQSYTASLASMLTVRRLRPTFIDLEEIKTNNDCVGYKKGSFIKTLLTEHLGFNESMLKPYETPEEFHQALSNGEVAAIIDEIPYIKLFLTKYGSRYSTVGPTYKTGGFGFAFPLKSPLVSYFSRAILNVTEDKDKFEGIQNKYFSSGIIFDDQSASITSDSPTLTVYSFAGLFIITGVTSGLSLFLYLFKLAFSHRSILRSIHSRETAFLSVLVQMAKLFNKKDSSSSLSPSRSESRVHPTTSDEGGDGTDNHSRALNQEAEIVTLNEDDEIIVSPDHEHHSS